MDASVSLTRNSRLSFVRFSFHFLKSLCRLFFPEKTFSSISPIGNMRAGFLSLGEEARSDANADSKTYIISRRFLLLSWSGIKQNDYR